MIGIVYILKSSKNGRFYIGSTNNLDRRLKQHFEGKSKYTKNNLPLELAFAQEYKSLRDARKIEFRLKQLKRQDIIEKIIEEKQITMGL